MKYVILIFAMIGVVPLSMWLRNNPRHIQKIWMLIGFLPFGDTIVPHFNIALVSWADWPGFVKGLELTALDVLLFAVYLALPNKANSLAFRIPFFLYFAAVIIVVPLASIPTASVFYVWQLFRMFFVYLVIARAAQDEDVVNSILGGLMIGICYEAVLVIWQRFALGDLQTAGTMGHQNGLGMTTYFVAFPFFALYLAGAKGWKPLIAPLAGATVAIMTVSRATIALSGLGFAILLILAAINRLTPRVTKTCFVALALTLIAIPFVVLSFQQRFGATPLPDDYDERAAFERSAAMMISDHPFGIGANNFVVVANTQGYFDRGGVAAIFGSRSAHVHNSYLLAAAETGYFGAFAFVIMLLAPLLTAFRVGWRNRRDARGALLLGLAVAMLMLYVQLFFEWAFFLWWFQYIFAVSVGLTGGLAHQLSYGAKERSKAETIPTKLLSSVPKPRR